MITDSIAERDKLRPSRCQVEPWLWPNLASLDAPAIAVLWQLLLARGLRVRVSPVEPLVLGLAVWSVYVSDRIFDALRPPMVGWEPARKLFYRRHFRVIATAGLCLTLLVAPFAYWSLRRSTFYGGLAIMVPVICYFGLVHLGPAHWRGYWPREAVVASLFTLGTFLGVWMGNGRNTQEIGGPATLFSLLCWANCSAIEIWEWERSFDRAAEAPSRSTRWAGRHLSAIAGCIALLAAAFGLLSASPPGFSAAAFGSGLALALLAAFRSHVPANVLRVGADAALCTPLLALVWAWVR